MCIHIPNSTNLFLDTPNLLSFIPYTCVTLQNRYCPMQSDRQTTTQMATPFFFFLSQSGFIVRSTAPTAMSTWMQTWAYTWYMWVGSHLHIKQQIPMICAMDTELAAVLSLLAETGSSAKKLPPWPKSNTFPWPCCFEVLPVMKTLKSLFIRITAVLSSSEGSIWI